MNEPSSHCGVQKSSSEEIFLLSEPRGEARAWAMLTETAEHSLLGPVFMTTGLRAAFLVIHMISFGRGCPLNLLFWTSFSEAN